MEFAYKPDYEDALRHWEAFWAGEIIDRPCIRVVTPKEGVVQKPPPPGLHKPTDDFAAIARASDECAATLNFAADAIPFFLPNFGPDTYAAFMGASLEFAPEHSTSWTKPFVTDWKDVTKRLERPHGYWWERALAFASQAREIAKGKLGIAMLDLHCNMDCLAAIRGPQQLCLDLVDCPDEVEAAFKAVRKSYAEVYDGLFEAAGGPATGSSTWLPMYSPGKFNTIACDFICLLGPELARKFVIPCLEEEAAFLDHSCYHYDGPDALVHLDDILSIKDIHAIQWGPGAGSPPVIEWMDLLKKIQAAGKALWISTTPAELKVFHKELKPELVVYSVSASSEAEANELIKWLKDNT